MKTSESGKGELEKRQQYIEHLSHEIMTPLAIIKSKAELLLQSPALREEDLLNTAAIIETVDRLTSINKGLILLSKIHQGIYIDREQISVVPLIQKMIQMLNPIAESKNIQIEITSELSLTIETNKTLFEILILNTLKNALIHNIQDGTLKIWISNDGISFENTGLIGKKEIKELFKRFVSGAASPDSIGLGLSIMKQICEQLDYQLDYKRSGHIHRLNITF
ncbi:MAG: HAMP domain-containing histidine kinase [Bacteroidetes bacterium]|nr:MAG: HAMP domain-containing histidine kinase [Bacteroidota bacterium]